MIIVLFFIGLIVTILSSLYISRKVYRTLNYDGNKFAGFFSIIFFLLSLFVIGLGVLYVWVQLSGGFSRR
jgi:hypothetical protein